MAESLTTRMTRWRFNWFPAYRGTGGRITYIAEDWREIHVRVPLHRSTRNIVGTIFGGSIYGAVDPMYMIMLMKCLGSGYTVWDKAATIRFKRPGRSTLFARFALEESELQAIRHELKDVEKLEREYVIDLVDKTGEVHAVVTKTIHIRRNRRG